jgi:hypothetical protein
VRLRGAGEVQAGTLDQPGGARLEWQARLTTEDDMFAADPRPPAIGMKPLTVTFERPGGVIFEASRGPAREDR